MTDIVDRLRAGEPHARWDAANEIERLRAELEKARLGEREACAKIADEIRRGAEARHKLANYFSDACIDACAQMGAAGAIAKAIRRRTIEAKRLDRAAANASTEKQEGGDV